MQNVNITTVTRVRHVLKLMEFVITPENTLTPGFHSDHFRKLISFHGIEGLCFYAGS